MAESEVDDEIRERLNTGFLGKLLVAASLSSREVQSDYLEQVAQAARIFRDLLEQHYSIYKPARSASEFWREIRGCKSSFIDGGVANIDLPGAAPLGIRVGAYSVVPGSEDVDRESFQFNTILVDDLYAESPNIFDDAFEDIDKLRDAARIVAESSALRKIIRDDNAIKFAFLHGPLINPTAPYGLDNFPAFQSGAIKYLIGDDIDVSEYKYFIPLYKKIIEDVRDSAASVVGVVERSKGAAPGLLAKHVLRDLVNKNVLPSGSADKLARTLKSYNVTDVVLFGALLREAEYVFFQDVSKQGERHKWPEDWKFQIESFPSCSVGYVKPSEHQEPIRIEFLCDSRHAHVVGEYVYFLSRLLPEYAFPVGLDIVDKYAKVPSWMSGQIRKDQAVWLLKKALKAKDPRAIEFAKRMLVSKGRDWLFRPKGGA